MDEYTVKNEINNQGTIQGLNQGIYNSQITQYFYGPEEQIKNINYGSHELDIYLRYLIKVTQTLTLSDGNEVPLERIYVSLRADEMNETERKAEQSIYIDTIANLQKSFEGSTADPYAISSATWKIIAHHPTMLKLQTRDWERSFDANKPASLNLAEVIQRHRYVVLLGDPGSGKTTLAKWLVLQYAQALRKCKTHVHIPANIVKPGTEASQIFNLGPVRLPIMVRIADYAQSRWDEKLRDTELSLEDFLYLQYDQKKSLSSKLSKNAIRALMRDYLKQGRALIVFDGLDEVGDPIQRRDVMIAIKEFIQQQRSLSHKHGVPGNCIVLTSRIIGYQFQPLIHLPHYTIEDMDEVAITTFCRAWMKHVAKVPSPLEQARKLKDAIYSHSHKGVHTLAGNPLLLTILAQIYWTDPERVLPRHRVTLFDAATTAMYKQREVFWKQSGISRDLLTEAMGSVAVHIHEHERTGFAEKGTVCYLLGRVLSHSGQIDTALHAAKDVAGFLIARGEGVYGFLHRALQEYFAAKYLVKHPEHLADNLGPKLLNPLWREPIVLAIGMVSLPTYRFSLKYLSEVFDLLLNTPDPAGDFLPRRELLAAAAWLECERVPPDTVQKIVTNLLTRYAEYKGRSKSPVLRRRIHQTFTALYEDLAKNQGESALCDALIHSDFERRFAALDIIINTNWTSPSIMTAAEIALCNTLHEPDIEHRFAALDIIIENEWTSPSILAAAETALCSALQNSHLKYRVAAVDVLAATEWSSPALAQALVTSWCTYAEPADSLLDALNIVSPTHFRPAFLPFRKAVMQDTLLWRNLSLHPQWRAMTIALYLPDGIDFHVEAINRDSPLTEYILAVLQSPSTQEALLELQEYLISFAVQPGTASTRDAALALTILGDQSWITRYVVNAGTHAAKIYPLVTRLIGLFNISQLSASLERHLEDAFYQRFIDDENDPVESLTRFEHYYLNKYPGANPLNIPDCSVEILKDNIKDLHSYIESAAAGIAKLDAPLTNLNLIHDFAIKLVSDFRNADQIMPYLHKELRNNRNAWADHNEFISRTNRLLTLTNILRRTIPACIHISQVLVTLIKTFQEYQLAAPEQVIPPTSTEQLTSNKISALVDDLAGLDDIQREKAREALAVKRYASALGKNVVEQIVTLMRCNLDKPQISTHLEWALKHIVHDTPFWITVWIEQSHQGDEVSQIILGSIHNITPEAFTVLLRSLPSLTPRVNLPLLKSLLWLTRSKRIPQNRQYTILLRLFDWLDNEIEPDARRAIIKILGHWQDNQRQIITLFLTRLNHPTLIYDSPAIYMALARLVAHIPELNAVVQQALEAACPQQDAAAALVRLKWIQVRTPRSLSQLLEHTPLKPEECLRALLDAGADDDVWKPEYHECLAKATRIYVEQHKLLPSLLEQLKQTILERDWTARRFATTVLAACIEAMPSAVQYAYTGDIEALLVKATTDANSSTSRRFAIRALSYLHTVTSAVVPALLAGCQDTKVVQKDTIAAASRFLSIKGDILSELTRALTSESARTAYAVAQLLGALGVSAAASDTNLRQQIIETLVDALKDPRSQREVVLLDPSTGKSDKITTVKLEDALYTALLQTAGWTG